MAKEYFEKLFNLITELDFDPEIFNLEIKHFFNGAALYLDNKIRVTLSPVGLAIKLPSKEVEQLIKSGLATYLKYFPKGAIKKDYALFVSPDLTQIEHWKVYLLQAFQRNYPI